MGRHPWLTVLLAVSLCVALWGWAGFLSLLVLAILVAAYWTGRRDERALVEAAKDAELEAWLSQRSDVELESLAGDGITPF